MRTPARGTLSAVLSLFVGLAVTLGLLGYGVTEELPVGSLKGRVKMSENQKPLPGAFITVTRIASAGELAYEDVTTERHFQADKNGQFTLRNMLAGNYTVELSAKAHQLKDQLTVKVTEGKPTELDINAAPVEPYLELYASQRVYMPSETAKIQLKGFAKQDAMSVGVYKLDFDKVLKEGGMYSALAPLARKDDAGHLKDPASLGAKMQGYQYVVKGRDAEGTFTDRLQVPGLKEGLYWVECNMGTLSRGTWLTVSKIAVIVKHKDREVRAFVTALDTGNPIQGASVGYATSGGMSGTVTTDAKGIVSLSLPPFSKSQKADVVAATFGESRALVDFNRNYSPSDGEGEGASAPADDTQTRIYTYTDRPIYRPGDLVQYKGIVRRLSGSDYSIPDAGSVTVQMQDAEGTVLKSEVLPLSSMGTYSGKYQFSPDTSPDNYQLVTKMGSASQTKDIGVAAYRKPTYSIKVHPEKASYIRGDKVRMLVDTAYYYGAPVVGAKVHAYVNRNPYWSWQTGSDDEDQNDVDFADQAYYDSTMSSRGGEQTQELDAVTDANGRAVLEFPSKGVNEPAEAESDFTYNVNVQVTDEGDKTFSGDGSVTVMRSDYRLTLDSDTRITEAGKAFTMSAVVKDASGKPLPGASVNFVSGFMRWTLKGREILADQQRHSGVTGMDGSAKISLTIPGSGFYSVRAEIQDNRGNLVTKTSSIYLEGAPSAFDEPPPASKLTLTLDKKQYKAGDTAKALITCQDPGGTAFVAIEGAQIYSTDAIRLDRKAVVYTFKVLDSYAPDVYVGISYVRNKKFKEASRRLLVDLGRRKLQVSVAPEKAVYHPGDTATYRVRTLDAAGNPTPAEVSLGVVDESIYAVFDDTSDILKAFYPKRMNEVETEYSFPELYLGGGDKAPTNIQIRKNFVDTAYWQPTVMTNAQGQAQISLKLPDNITSWRATVRAVTSNTEVGQATCNAIARKDLMVQLSAPAFVVNGDRQRMVAMVTNNTGADADVKVNMEPKGSKIEGPQTTTVHVLNGAVQTVEYQFSPNEDGETSFLAKAWIDNGASDGMELKVPVKPHARLVADGYAGITSKDKSLDLQVKQGAVKDMGELQVNVSPSIASSLIASIDQLVGFPYGCTEQTTSRFLPSIVFTRAAEELGLPKPKLASKIDQIVQDSYSRLTRMQHSDGGWGWWENDESEPYMTAYVLDAIHTGRTLGYEAPHGIRINGALDWAAKYVENPPTYKNLSGQTFLKSDENSIAYLTYTLALYGRLDDAKKRLAKVDVSKADAGTAAYTALAWNAVGAAGAAKRDAFLSRMVFLAKQTPSTAYWRDTWWGDETTARCFFALETLRPNDPLLSKIVTYLVQAKRGDMWFSTRDTSAAVISLVDYLRHNKEGLADSDVTVKLNGRELAHLHFNRGSKEDPTTKLKVPIAQLKDGGNTLAFEVHSGSCFYSATLRQYVGEQNMQAQSMAKGLTVTRTYYKLEAQRMEDGTLKMMPGKQPVTEVHTGDIIQCELKIHTDANRDYMLVEDPIPSSCRITAREDIAEGETWTWWWSRNVIFDDHIALFARNVPAGDHIMSYTLRAENPGEAHALPTSAYNMYDPADGASSAENALAVRG